MALFLPVIQKTHSCCNKLAVLLDFETFSLYNISSSIISLFVFGGPGPSKSRCPKGNPEMKERESGDSRAINRTSICDMVIEEIKNDILNKKYLPGQRIPSEAELSKYYNVGRGSIREALKRLEMVGLVSIIHGKGVVVADLDLVSERTKFLPVTGQLDIETFKDLMEARRIVETACLRSTCKNASKETLEEFKQLVNRMRANLGNPKKFTRFDLEFHMKIAEGSGNLLYIHFLNSIRDILKLEQDTLIQLKNADHRAYKYHTDIANAVVERDEGRAISLLLEHLNDVEEAFLADRSRQMEPRP